MFKHPYPLGLPKGSVRSLLALGSVAATIAAVFVGVAEQGLMLLNGLSLLAMGFYFKDRRGEERA